MRWAEGQERWAKGRAETFAVRSWRLVQSSYLRDEQEVMIRSRIWIQGDLAAEGNRLPCHQQVLYRQLV